ncbi:MULTISPECIES: phosphotransferase [unclassified Streptomyces]|uniref:phosphotransferase n=1 Tax=unclassified Streptomyces TaxID=2593676 RepID=UPI00093E8223|nr:phosphotransferase [Streptomyces sp. CB02400]OKK07200.1 aminoglycoside phosphotransferase [Streptomyces sp. CB02400]
MSPETPSLARQHAIEACGNPGAVEGPLQGYHHETYVFPLGDGAGVLSTTRWKCREPRAGLLWFDRRCFDSEEQLLNTLNGRITSIPEIAEFGGLRLQRFIEGRTLGSLRKPGLPIPGPLLQQVVGLFRELAEVRPETLVVKRRCEAMDRPRDGDTNGFLDRLVSFMEESVYLSNLDEFAALFEEVGVDGDTFKNLREHVSGLTERPFCLLHADLHRENFIVDSGQRLWTIDWELAMVGDPLYDLATHLYLMRYPEWQARRLTRHWVSTVEDVRPGSSEGWQRDLGLLMDFKKAQSVFTDVIRAALALGPGQGADRRRPEGAGRKLRRVLTEAAGPLGLTSVPAPDRIADALVRWRGEAGDVFPG